jgi:uncharacterized membrane protein
VAIHFHGQDKHAPTAIDPAWGVPSEHEPRWPASLAVVAFAGLWAALPNDVAVRPHVVLPPLLVLAALLLNLWSPRRHASESRWVRLASIGLIALLAVVNLVDLGFLSYELIEPSPKELSGLLLASFLIWLDNVIVFALLYWELDRGGPEERTSPHHRQPDFFFMQMARPGAAPPGWAPGFGDYLFLAFTHQATFGPTETMPLTLAAKLLTALQAAISLFIITLVVARGINILG